MRPLCVFHCLHLCASRHKPVAPVRSLHPIPAPARGIALGLAVALVFGAASSAARASCTDYSRYLHWMGSIDLAGWPSSVVVENGRAYAADYGHLTIIDVQDPTTPQIAGGISEGALGVDATREYLYVAGTPDLAVYGLYDPSHPTLFGTLDLPGTSYLVDVDGTHAYLGGESLHILDVSDPSYPAHRSTLALPGDASGLVVRDGYAYLLVQGSGLWIVDVSDPLHPFTAGSLVTSRVYRGLARAWPYLYVAAEQDGIEVINVADPAHPVVISTIDTYPDHGLAIGVTIIHGAAFVHCLPVTGLQLGTVQVYDLTDPETPTLQGGLAPGGWVAEADGFACVTGQQSFRTLNITNPTSPPVLGSVFYNPGTSDEVLADGTTVYATAWSSGLTIIDAGDETQPVIIGTYNTPGSAQGLDVVDGRAYVADGTAGLHILDVSTPANPTLLGTLDTSGAEDVVVSGGWAYLADGWGAFKIIDVSQPAAPSLASTLALGYCHAVALAGDYVLAAEVYYGGMQVIDVSDPFSPRIVGSIAMDGPQDLAVDGEFVHAASINDGLTVIRLTDPEHPVRVARIPLPDAAGSVALDGSTLYVTGGYMGLLAFDVSDPLSPRSLGAANIPGAAMSVDAAGGNAFVSVASRGLRVVAGHCSEPSGVSTGGEGGTPGMPSLSVDAHGQFLRGGMPSPFQTTTTLSFKLPGEGAVELGIYDTAGRQVSRLIHDRIGAGEHTVRWDGRDDTGRLLPAGVYFARMDYRDQRGDHPESARLLLLR